PRARGASGRDGPEARDGGRGPQQDGRELRTRRGKEERRTRIVIRVVVAALLGVLLVPAAIEISARARSLQPGELVVLSIAGPERTDAVHVRAFGRDVVAYPAGDHEWRALVGIDLDVTPGAYPVTVDAGSPPQHGVYDLIV